MLGLISVDPRARQGRAGGDEGAYVVLWRRSRGCAEAWSVVDEGGERVEGGGRCWSSRSSSSSSEVGRQCVNLKW